MKRIVMAAALAGLLNASPACAGQLIQVQLQGVLTSELDLNNPYDNPNPDAHLSVGTTFELTARIDSDSLINVPGYSFQEVGVYGLGTTGDQYWRIDAGGLTWQTTDNEEDYEPFLTYYNVDTGQSNDAAFPGMTIENGKVIGLSAAQMYPTGGGRPSLDLTSGVVVGGSVAINSSLDAEGNPVVVSSNVSAFTLGDTFNITWAGGKYANYYNTQGFVGVWDFADSSVTAVPEPMTWAMLLTGFGAIGGSLRRNRIRAWKA